MIYPDLFLKVIRVVLKNEGGYSNNPNDTGSETNYGISHRAYPTLDIKNLTIAQAIDIYYNDYWLPMNLEGIIEDDLILQLFDAGVNMGIRTAIKLLQRLIGVGDDGHIGEVTRKAIREFNGNIVDEFIKRRKLFYITLAQNKPDQHIFLKGWIRRIEQTKF
jgi:lysozyme family protein